MKKDEIKLSNGEMVDAEKFNKTINKYNVYMNANLTGIKDRGIFMLLVTLFNQFNLNNMTLAHSTLAKQCNMSVATAKRKLNNLKKLGLIDWKSGKSEKKMNEYSIIIEKYNELVYRVNSLNMDERLNYINTFFNQKPTKSLLNENKSFTASPSTSKYENDQDVNECKNGDKTALKQPNSSLEEVELKEEIMMNEDKIAIAASAQYSTENFRYSIKGNTLLTTTLPTVQFDNIEYSDAPPLNNQEESEYKENNMKDMMKKISSNVDSEEPSIEDGYYKNYNIKSLLGHPDYVNEIKRIIDEGIKPKIEILKMINRFSSEINNPNNTLSQYLSNQL